MDILEALPVRMPPTSNSFGATVSGSIIWGNMYEIWDFIQGIMVGVVLTCIGFGAWAFYEYKKYVRRRGGPDDKG